MTAKLRAHPIAALLGYLVLYLAGFALLERWDRPFHIMHCRLDRFIPFVPAAVVPYLLWFVWVPGLILWFLRRHTEDFWRLFTALALGNTAALCVFAVYPTAQLRRRALPGSDVFSALRQQVYRSDTPTNVCPSLHVSVSVTVLLAVLWGTAAVSRGLRRFNAGMCAAVCASTVLVGQHSCVDVFWGVVLACAAYGAAGLLLRRSYGPWPVPPKRRLRRC